jgi:hypothetical protein
MTFTPKAPFLGTVACDLAVKIRKHWVRCALLTGIYFPFLLVKVVDTTLQPGADYRVRLISHYLLLPPLINITAVLYYLLLSSFIKMTALLCRAVLWLLL